MALKRGKSQSLYTVGHPEFQKLGFPAQPEWVVCACVRACVHACGKFDVAIGELDLQIHRAKFSGPFQNFVVTI